MPLEEVENPLIWWSKHEGQFFIVPKLAKAILSIPSSQIKIERVFSIIGILTGLCRCHLGPKNLDVLVLMIKNWPNDP
jgi:hypothetical protein